MSIVVDLERLAATLADYGTGYLLTASADGSVKAVTVEPTWADGVLHLGASRGSAANLATNPKATVIFPPLLSRGYTLIVDGTGDATDEGIDVRAEKAVLHRPASHSDGPGAPEPATGCGHDCAPI